MPLKTTKRAFVYYKALFVVLRGILICVFEVREDCRADEVFPRTIFLERPFLDFVFQFWRQPKANDDFLIHRFPSEDPYRGL